MDPKDLAAVFTGLPTRLYLDTGVLQRLWDFGGVVWEGEPFEPSARAARIPYLADDLEALHRIFGVNDRAGFEFVVTEASLREVEARGQPGYTQWARDVEGTWLVQSEGVLHEPVAMEPLGSVSSKDWLLVHDALTTRCDGFLTVDRPLASQAPIVVRKAGLRVLLPTDYWALLAPWALLWR